MTSEKNPAGLIQIQKAEDVCPGKKSKLTLEAVRERIDFATAHDQTEKTGPEYWRSLEELAGSEEFQTALHREFPKGASEWLDTVSRRGFLKLMGASLAMAGMTACAKLPPSPSFLTSNSRKDYPWAPYFTRLLLLSADTLAQCWSRAICIVPQKLKVTISIRRALVEPTSLRRLRS